jgi:hypothetical protein
MRVEQQQVVFLAWQDPASRAWFPIGRLSCEGGEHYRFVYTRGYLKAHGEAGLVPLIGFSDVHQVYESSELFPLFKNRIMSRQREDYPSYVARMALPEAPSPLSLLARSAGRRSTDSFEIFPWPLVRGEQGDLRFRVDFFVHGIRHMPPAAATRAGDLAPGERLLLLFDWQNPEDPRAVALRTEDKVLLGYAPRYYGEDLERLRSERAPARVEVLQVNLPPAPIQQRLLVRLDAPWTARTEPLSSEAYQPLADAPRLAG